MEREPTTSRELTPERIRQMNADDAVEQIARVDNVSIEEAGMIYESMIGGDVVDEESKPTPPEGIAS